MGQAPQDGTECGEDVKLAGDGLLQPQAASECMLIDVPCDWTDYAKGSDLSGLKAISLVTSPGGWKFISYGSHGSRCDARHYLACCYADARVLRLPLLGT